MANLSRVVKTQDEILEQYSEKCKNVFPFGDRDIIELEITNKAFSGIVTDFGLIKGGKQVIDILGSNILKLLDYVATREDVDHLKTMVLQHNKKKAIKLKALQDQADRENAGSSSVVLTEGDLEYKMSEWKQANNPYRAFSEERGYDMLPIHHVRFISNKGPSATDAVAKDTKDKDMYAAMMQQNAIILEMMKELQKTNKTTK